ncbi:EnvZ/OmpR regulon moderator MzrA [Brenneria populi]|uniref:Modulator protein MzrA n=1 Tax=Brenneria populi TaxID=1505588 RepID=A0ABU6JQ88_9GAMM|nr:EnvZ/OmpR regulon moderator MzrA [Brenneria populi Li et al. 2015]
MLIRWFYPKKLWRIVLLVAVPLFALMLVPHRSQDEAQLHIQPLYQGAALPDGFYIYQRLNERGIAIKSITPAEGSLIVRLASPAQSAEARNILRTSLPKASITTQQTINPPPFWQQKLTQKQSNLG